MTINNLPIPISNRFDGFRKDCDRGGFILPFLAGLAVATPLLCCRRPYPYPYPMPYPYPYPYPSPYYGGYPGGGVGPGGQFTFQGQGQFRTLQRFGQQPCVQSQIFPQGTQIAQAGFPGRYGGSCSLLFPFYPEYCFNSPYCYYHGHPYYQSVALNPFYPCIKDYSC